MHIAWRTTGGKNSILDLVRYNFFSAQERQQSYRHFYHAGVCQLRGINLAAFSLWVLGKRRFVSQFSAFL